MNSDLSPKFPLEIPVDMPSAAEIEGQISEIVAKGIQKESAFRILWELFHTVGLRRIFYGMYSILFILLSGVVLLLVLLYNGFRPDASFPPYGMALSLAPLVFLSSYLLCVWKEKSEGTFEIPATCRYSFCHLLAFRLIVFTLFGLLITFFSAFFFLPRDSEDSFFHLAGISLFSMFGFSLFLLHTLTKNGRKKHLAFVACLVWLGITCIPLIWDPWGWEKLLRHIPNAFFFSFGLLFAVLYSREIKNLCFLQKRGCASC